MTKDRLQKSVKREVGADNVRAFSSFSDFVNHYLANGLIESRDDLLKNDDLLIKTVFAWIRQLQVGCVFAGMLAHDPAEHRWRSEVVRTGFDVEKLNARVDELVVC